MTHGYLMEVPLDDGENTIVVEVDPRDVPDDLVLAARSGERSGAMAEKASVTLETALKRIQPGVKAIAEWAQEAKPTEFTVEFGLKLGGQTGFIVASGTAEVNFVVTLAWKSQ